MNDAKEAKHFLLVGNGPYANRGCEAIVRGTMAILRNEFGENFRVTLGTFATPDLVAKQAATETDPLITHVALFGKATHRWSGPWWRRQLLTRCAHRSGEETNKTYAMLDSYCSDATCALQIGGDNYTLDYGIPQKFILLDNYLRQFNVPIVLWGASVGPFENDPAFATEIFVHLRTIRSIFVRESDSHEYLKQHGVDANLTLMSDPAFVMEPVEPAKDKIGCELPANAIGLNLSPLMAKYVTAGDMDAWVKIGADIARSIVETTRHSVLLIPHVTNSGWSDHTFLHKVTEACFKTRTAKIFCLGDKLSAAETKWIISHCKVFIGARTHSTIAALSTCVPTLSLAYSRKAHGLNQDIFGSQAYCVQPSEITPCGITERIIHLLAQGDSIRAYLTHALPPVKQKAFQAGTLLRQLMERP